MQPSDPIFKKESSGGSASYTPPGAPLSEESTPPSLEKGEEKKERGAGLAVASLVLGLFGIICCSCCGLPTGIVGVVLSLWDRAKRGRFDGLALAGLITSIISILLCIFSFVIFFALGIMDGLLDDGMVIPPAEVLAFWRLV